MPSLTTSAQFRVHDAMARLPGPAGQRFVELASDGAVTVELYAPRGHDPQQPHDRDEIYAVVEGRGDFVCGDTRRVFGPGDLLLVPAHVPHRFEHFTDDLIVWVIFVGPPRRA